MAGPLDKYNSTTVAAATVPQLNNQIRRISLTCLIYLSVRLLYYRVDFKLIDRQWRLT